MKYNFRLLIAIPNHYELTDIKRLLSFLVQQNEQSRLQQKKAKEQNDQIIQEINRIEADH